MITETGVHFSPQASPDQSLGPNRKTILVLMHFQTVTAKIGSICRILIKGWTEVGRHHDPQFCHYVTLSLVLQTKLQTAGQLDWWSRRMAQLNWFQNRHIHLQCRGRRWETTLAPTLCLLPASLTGFACNRKTLLNVTRNRALLEHFSIPSPLGWYWKILYKLRCTRITDPSIQKRVSRTFWLRNGGV